MERELLITGIGGQGVQLAAQVLARAATLEGRDVMYLGLYGGMMRGGNTDSTVVSATRRSLAPPVVSHAWSAIAMHDEFWAPVEPKLRPGGLVLVNDATFTTRDRGADVTVHRVPATDVATELGNPLGGSMVMLGAYCGDHRHRRRSTRSIEAMRAVDPAVPHAAHRSQRARAPRRAGSSCPPDEFPAWETERGACLSESSTTRRSRAAAPSPSTSSTARAATSASPRARRGVLDDVDRGEPHGLPLPRAAPGLHRLRGVPLRVPRLRVRGVPLRTAGRHEMEATR